MTFELGTGTPPIVTCTEAFGVMNGWFRRIAAVPPLGARSLSLSREVNLE